MKRFVVEQTGYVQLEATRRFVVEVPDDLDEQQAQKLIEELQETLPEEEDMAWWDQPDRSWNGYDVEIEATDVYDPDTDVVIPKTDGLRVIRLGALDKNICK